jgi:signal transduction histidine kinase
MQIRLARYVKDRVQMLAAVSHDLRTPITRLRLRAESLDDTNLKDKVLRDLNEMETLVNAALEFMRDTNYAEELQPVDITALLESIQSDMEEMGKDVQINGEAQQPFPARPSALKRCFTNLLENAVKYGERAIVSVEDKPQSLRVTIADTGPGIPEKDLEQVFEPFVRLDSARGGVGAGLGLSIARNIAHAHGGDLILRNRKGGGVEAILTLPRVTDINAS